MEKENTLALKITTKELSGLMKTVEQVREGKVSPEKLKEIIDPMKNKVKEAIDNLPGIKKKLEKVETKEGVDPFNLIKDGLNIYRKTLDTLSMFLTDSRKEHLEKGLESAKEAHHKLVTIEEVISRVTGL